MANIDSVFIPRLMARLREIEQSYVDSMVRGIAPERYHNACGRVQLIRELTAKDGEIEQILDKLRDE